MIYKEQMYRKLLNLVDNNCWIILQWTNTTLVISKGGICSPFLSLVILLSVLPSNFIVKILR